MTSYVVFLVFLDRLMFLFFSEFESAGVFLVETMDKSNILETI